MDVRHLTQWRLESREEGTTEKTYSREKNHLFNGHEAYVTNSEFGFALPGWNGREFECKAKNWNFRLVTSRTIIFLIW